MQKIELEIVALSQSIAQSHSYAVVLGETEGHRRLPIIIGAHEAQAIALALEKMNPPRPLTHDLTKNICDEFKIVCKEIIIDKLVEGVFHAKLICSNGTNDFEIDSRTSDAIAMAVRFRCPIYSYEFILGQAGIILEMETKETESSGRRGNSKVVDLNNTDDFTKLETKDLKEKLQSLLDNEEYEKAIPLRDEIKRREQDNS